MLMRRSKLCGDVDYAKAEPIVDAITPVPGGVGSVTTSRPCRTCCRSSYEKVLCKFRFSGISDICIFEVMQLFGTLEWLHSFKSYNTCFSYTVIV